MKMISKSDLPIIQTWVIGQEKGLEFSVQGRTFQISGIHGAMGLYERHFYAGSHPTRSTVNAEAMVDVLNSATTKLRLYWGSKKDNRSDAVEFFPNADAALAAAKAWAKMPAEVAA